MTALPVRSNMPLLEEESISLELARGHQLSPKHVASFHIIVNVNGIRKNRKNHVNRENNVFVHAIAVFKLNVSLMNGV